MHSLTFVRTIAALAASLSLAHCASSVGNTDAAPLPDASTDAARPADASIADVPVTGPDAQPGECSTLPLEELRVARVVRRGTPAPFAVRANGAGCSCTAELVPGPNGGPELRACRCCQACPCIDLGYVATSSIDLASAPDQLEFRVGDRSAPITVIPDGTMCLENARIERVRVVTDDGIQRVGPRHIWLEVSGTAPRCSSNPFALIEAMPGNPMFLRAFDCNLDDCDGPTRPQPYTTWLSLGELAPGSYSLFYSPGVSQNFEVR